MARLPLVRDALDSSPVLQSTSAHSVTRRTTPYSMLRHRPHMSRAASNVPIAGPASEHMECRECRLPKIWSLNRSQQELFREINCYVLAIPPDLGSRSRP